MKMNTNGAASSDGVGPYCYHFTSLWTATASYVSNDFIGIADGVTVNGTVKVMTSHVCGIYDPLVANFPTVSSKLTTTYLCYNRSYFTVFLFSAPTTNFAINMKLVFK